MDTPLTVNQPGTAIINALEAYPRLHWIRDGTFDLLTFLDFCVGIEAAVLYEKLITIGPFHPDITGNPIVESLLESEVLEGYLYDVPVPVGPFPPEFSTDPSKLPRGSQILEFISHEKPITTDSLRILFHAQTLAPDVMMEDHLETPLIPTAHHLPLYLLLPNVQRESAAFRKLQHTLSSTYASYREALLSLRREYDGEDLIRIPPIALEALDACEDLDRIGDIVLDLRYEYYNVRKWFTELDETFRSVDVTLTEKIKARRSMNKAVASLFSTDELDSITVATSFAKRLNESLDWADLADKADPSGINWSKLVGWLIEKGEAIYWRFRLRPLHATKRRYLDTSSRQLATVISKHFGHELGPDDLAVADRYTKGVQALTTGLRVG